LVQKKQCLVPLLPKWDVRVFIPKILLKNLNTNIRYLLVPVPFQLFIILENSAFPMYSIPVILKKVVTVVCLPKSKLFFCFLTKAERIFCAGFLMFKEVSRLVLVPSELLFCILQFKKKFRAPPRFAYPRTERLRPKLMFKSTRVRSPVLS
jgi:hypothetical protein